MDIRTERLIKAFNESGLTQAELCNATGITKGALSSYLSGRYFPKQKAVEKLAAVLKVSVVYLLGMDEASSSSEADQVDRLFIEKYSRDVYDAAMKYSKLDATDRVRATERIDMMLEDPKYRLGGEFGEKAI